ncbi:MAG TPA: lysylphosphatidylglycerol synthase domain-containing protein [Rhizomicrobium sp.]
MRLLAALVLGLGVLAVVLLHFDLGAVAAALARAGLGGFGGIVLAGLAAEVVLAVGLVPLLPRPLPLWVIAASRQLRDSASDVLPITQLGGVAFAARALVLAGLGAAEASAAVIADLTAETFAQGLYVLVGVLASLSLLRHSPQLSPYVGAMLGGALFLSAGSIGFALLQLGGSRWAGRLGEKLFATRATHALAFQETVHAIYGRHARVALSILLQFAGWIASGLWLWVMLRAMGLTAGLWTAIAIQALVEGLRSATVFIPAAVGVQEAGYAVLAPVFGLTPEIGLALSLLRRARDVVVAVPVLLLWQAAETRRAAQADK